MHELSPRIPDAFTWREAVQHQLRTLLAASPIHAGLTVEEWRAVKARWLAFIRAAGRNLLQRERAPITARLISEARFDGFRVQKLIFASFPGWQVGLNLYLPLLDGPYTPILCPCGHGAKWQDDHQIPPQVLARNGFAAALFDMPMFGEKERGNDHFIQGSQAALVGRWSNEFFLLDALRVADYLETRADITFARGMGVTGVSGGGFATLYLAALDDRVRAIVPVCSTAPLGGHLIEGLYTGCPENYLFGQARMGMDFNDPLGLAAPTPCLVIGGRQDTIFTSQAVTQSVEKAKKLYALEDAEDHIELFFDDCPHQYTAVMAAEAARWFRRWLLGDGDPVIDDTFTLLPQEALDCGTADTTIGMIDVIRQEVARLAERRQPAVANEDIAAVLRLPVPAPGTLEELPPAAWGYPGLRKSILHTAGGVPIPIITMPCPDAPAGTLVCFTEAGSISPLRQVGGLWGMCARIIAADLRGFGALAPAPSDYDIYGWCSVDRALGDLLTLCGETIMGGQVADALQVLDIAADDDLTVFGQGEAALPALFAGLLHPRVGRIVLQDFPASFALLATAEQPTWSRYQYLPGVLERFDLAELFRGRNDREFLLIHPLDGEKQRLDMESAERLYDEMGLRVRLYCGEEAVAGVVSDWGKGR